MRRNACRLAGEVSTGLSTPTESRDLWSNWLTLTV